MDTKKMVLLCGVNGTGKSTIARKFENDGYVIVDVDKSNFDTKSKKSAYRTHFNKYLIEKLGKEIESPVQLDQDTFDKMFDGLFEGECNKDASLTLLTMFEAINGGEKTTGSDREYAIDELYKAVLAPVYKADTMKNLHDYKSTITERIVAKKIYYKKCKYFMKEAGFRGEFPSEDAFVEEFLNLYKKCGEDPTEALITFYEKLANVKISGNDRAKVSSFIFNKIVASGITEDILVDIENESKKPICIDIGSRKFFFVSDTFMNELEEMEYAPEIIYMNLDIEKNLNNLFSIKDGKYVISDRLNLTGVAKTYLESLITSGIETVDGVELKEIAEGIVSKKRDEKWSANYRQLTELSEKNPELKNGIRNAIKEYMVVRQNTLGTHLEGLLSGQKSSSVHKIDITMEDEPNTVYDKMNKVLEQKYVVLDYFEVDSPTSPRAAFEWTKKSNFQSVPVSEMATQSNTKLSSIDDSLGVSSDLHDYVNAQQVIKNEKFVDYVNSKKPTLGNFINI